MSTNRLQYVKRGSTALHLVFTTTPYPSADESAGGSGKILMSGSLERPHCTAFASPKARETARPAAEK